MKSFLYLLNCKNNSLYTGITTNLQQRYMEHLSGKGSKYCRAFKVKNIVIAWCFDLEKHRLIPLERKIQKLSKVQKLDLIKQPELMKHYLQQLELLTQVEVVDLKQFKRDLCPCSKNAKCQFYGVCAECIQTHLTKVGKPPMCFATRPKWVINVAKNYKLAHTKILENWLQDS